jgi:GTPase SAR1 family protein
MEKEIREFWSKIWSNKIEHKEGTWLNEIKYDGQDMKYEEITTEDVQRAIIKTNNWKTPGSDHIQNYWWKRFTATHPYLAKQLSRLIANPEGTPHFFTEGKTYLIPKDLNDCTDPSKCRPITCLPTIYKILTSCISDKIHKHLQDNKITADQQKGCARNTRGCKEQLLIDSIILEQTKKQKKKYAYCLHQLPKGI